jgi:hypothetical protein
LDSYYAYLDESGDLGWNFQHPYQKGGSSRFLTIAAILVHKNDKHRPGRALDTFKKKLNVDPKSELKATDLTSQQRILFMDIFLHEASKAKQYLRIISKTVSKMNVQHPRFRTDSNTLYNYTTSLCLLDKIASFEKVDLFADSRVTKVDARLSFNQYLVTKLAGDMNSSCDFNVHHVNSQHSQEVQCADILTNIIWRSYEFDVQWEKEKIFSLMELYIFNYLFDFRRSKCTPRRRSP